MKRPPVDLEKGFRFNMHCIRKLSFGAVSVTAAYLLLAIEVFVAHSASASHAEEKKYGMLSIEWLVDESEVIAVVRETHNPDQHKVLRAIKGDAASVDWSAIQFQKRVNFFEPPSVGERFSENTERARLLFIRERAELLQSVSLERSDFIESIDKTANPEYKEYPRRGVESRLYGVNQFGELLLTSSKLFRAIEDRMKAARNPIDLCPGVGKHLGGEGDLSARYAPDLFPLNNDDEVYYLVVPYDTSRRDQFLKQLVIGDAAEKLYAIRELSIFEDSTAAQAIKKAAECTEATEVFHFDKSSRAVVAWTAADVRAAAKAELRKMPSK